MPGKPDRTKKRDRRGEIVDSRAVEETGAVRSALEAPDRLVVLRWVTDTAGKIWRTAKPLVESDRMDIRVLGWAFTIVLLLAVPVAVVTVLLILLFVNPVVAFVLIGLAVGVVGLADFALALLKRLR